MTRPSVRRAARVCLTLGVLGYPAIQPRSPLWAQQAAGACAPDTATRVLQLALGLEPDAGLPDTAAAFAAQLARQIATFVEPPTRLSIDRLRGPSEWRDGEASHRSAGLLSIGQLVVALGPDGRVREAGLDPGTGSPEVDHALLSGVVSADSGGVFQAAPGSSDVRRVRLWVLTAPAPAPSWATPVFRVVGRVPAAATPATVVEEPAPRYPAPLAGTGREGEVYVAFDVDEAGTVPEGSVRVLSADDSAFVPPALAAIRAGHYAAGTQGGCPVRMTLRQRVRFRAAAGGGGAVAAAASATMPPARWLAESLPPYSRITGLLEVRNLDGGAGMSGVRGGDDIVQVHVSVVRAALTGCTLSLTQRFDREPSDLMTRFEIMSTVPLDHADPRSLRVERRAPATAMIQGNAWHVLLSLRDGAVHSEYRQGGREAGSGSGGWLDLPVPDARSGAAIVNGIGRALRDCAPAGGQ
jgi:TonB family protein